MIYVVGSGPSGISAAKALLKQYIEVTMLDGGVELEDEKKKMIQEMDNSSKDDWKEESIATMKRDIKATVSGIPIKYAYGSDFHYRDSMKYTPANFKGVQVFSSLAKGGLSNVWGAAILPYREEDLHGWPIKSSDLHEHYKAVTDFMPVSAKNDDLSQHFPLYTDLYHSLKMSEQAKEFLIDVERSKEELNSMGVVYGQARLADIKFLRFS